MNLFSLPYTYGDPTKNPGVPLKLRSGVTEEKPSRGTVAGVYEQIEKDLSEGARLMLANPQNLTLYRMNGTAAYGLLSRAYLYMGKWDKCIEYADSVFKENKDLAYFPVKYGVFVIVRMKFYGHVIIKYQQVASKSLAGVIQVLGCPRTNW